MLPKEEWDNRGWRLITQKSLRSEEEIDRHVFVHFEPFPQILGIDATWMPLSWFTRYNEAIELTAEGSIAFLEELEKPNPEARKMLERIREKYKDMNMEDLIERLEKLESRIDELERWHV